jgi:hypothetical protein
MSSRTRKTENRSWTPTLGESLTDAEARQVKCLTSDAGHVWMPTYDALAPSVRLRLANSPFNICAACMFIKAHGMARKPTLAVYFACIEAIEKELR